MTELDRFNLIEEFIKKSNTSIDSAVVVSGTGTSSTRSNSVEDTNTTTSNNKKNNLLITIKSQMNNDAYLAEKSNKKKLAPRLDDLFLSINVTSSELAGDTSTTTSDDLYLTPSNNQEITYDSKIELKIDACGVGGESLITPLQRPKRPYSYYVATNFHPLDLIENEDELKQLIQPTQKQQINKIENNKKGDVVTNGNTKRLSMSLGDIKMRRNRGRNNNVNTNNNTNTKSSEKNKEKKYSSQNNIENVGGNSEVKKTNTVITVSSTTLPRRGGNTTRKSHHRSTSRINRFFRLLFRMSDDEEELGAVRNDDAVIVDDEEIYKNDGALNKFTRLFSFRGSNANMNSHKTFNNNNSNNNRASTLTTSTNGTVNSGASDCKAQSLIVMDEQPSKVLPQIQLSTIEAVSSPVKISIQCEKKVVDLDTPKSLTAQSASSSTSSSSPSKISGEHILCPSENNKSQFYTEITDRLKKIASTPTSESRSEDCRLSPAVVTCLSSGTASESGYLVTGLDSIIKDHIHHPTSNTNSPKSANSSSISSPTPNSTSLLSSSSSTSNEKQNFNTSTVSSLDLIDIPFIDEEVDSSNPDYNKEKLTPDELVRYIERSFDLKCNNSQVPDSIIKNFAENVNMAKLDEIFSKYLDVYEQVWLKIGAVFEFANRAVYLVENQSAPSQRFRINKIKEITASFLHQKFADWIYENGGWVILLK